jgi:hypothetical protein
MKRTILALGTIALALALTGGAWAGKRYVITSSSQVKNGALTGADIKNHSLKLGDLAKGTMHTLESSGSRGPKGDTGSQGPKGDTGSQGQQGPKGDKGDSGVDSPLVYTFAGATGPDTGVCPDNNGSPNQGWATDTYDSTYVVAMQPDGSYVLTKTVKGTFVTTAGVSEPTNCGSSQAGGVTGTLYGTESVTVPADSGFDPYASCGASCSPDTNSTLTSSNTAQNNAFVAAFYRSGVTGTLTSFDFTYDAGSHGHMEQNDNGVTGNITG